MNEAADLARRVELHAFFFEAADAQHLFEQVHGVLVVDRRLLASIFLRHQSFSKVDRSPSGNPNSLALSRRRIILPLRVFGTLSRNSMSRGATAGPKRARAWPSNSLRSASLGSKPFFRETKALTTSPIIGSGIPMTPASAMAGCSMSALSTSKGPIR